jgi:hypothetical protein
LTKSRIEFFEVTRKYAVGLHRRTARLHGSLSIRPDKLCITLKYVTAATQCEWLRPT